MHINLSVMRVGGDGVVITQRTEGAPNSLHSFMVGLDWSKRRSVNGKETMVIQPFSFPLELGRKWITEYTELNPTPQKTRETDNYRYRVVGWEEVAVPAGRFRALKVEAEGSWTADVAPKLVNNAVIARQGGVSAQAMERHVVQAGKASGRYYKCFWYVPAVKRWVKSVEENYAANGSLASVLADELESFNVEGANASGPSRQDPKPANAIAAPQKGQI